MEKEVVKYSGLRSEMAKYGHKNKTLAELLKLPEASISKRFSGETEWSIGEVEKICDFYKKEFHELFK